jgi:hypothetical protein
LIFIASKFLELMLEQNRSGQWLVYSCVILYSGYLFFLSNRQVKVWTSTKKTLGTCFVCHSK